MTEIQLGPFILSSARFSAIIALALFVLSASLLARKDARLTDWAWNTLLIILIGARVGFVLENLPAYRSDPLAVLYFWQGGFTPVWGLAAAALYSFGIQIGRAAVPVVAAGLVSWGAATMITTERSDEPVQLPDLTVYTLADEPVNLAAQRGEALVMNLWEPWCPPCRREMPMMAETAPDHPQVTVAFVNQTSGIREVEAFLEEQGIEAENVWRSPRSEVGAHFRSVGLPTTLFFAPDGTLRHRHIGEISRAEFERQLRNLTGP